MRTLYLDCFSGISGDMTVGALLDAGADFDALQQAIASLNITGFHIEAEKTVKRGIHATQFRVLQDPDTPQPLRHLRHVCEIIEGGKLPAPVQSAAIETFRLLAEAEASVHGATVEKVHFHEVGAIDSIVDIVAAQLALHALGVAHVVASPLHVGSGTVQCAHGILPVPAPATAALLKGKPVYGGEVAGELVTPTGAALIAQWVRAFGPAPPMTIAAIGYGSGTRDLPDRSNVLRVFLGETEADAPGFEPITVIEANIDDMTGELIPPLVAALLQGGARDAFVTPILAKKGRPAYVVSVLCDAPDVPPLTRILFEHSTTLGLRMREERRIVLERRFENVGTPWGLVRVKIGLLDASSGQVAPEFEECRALAEAAGVPVRRVYEAALAAAIKGEWDHA